MDETYNTLKTICDKKRQSGVEHNTLVSDSWTNVKGEPIINYCSVNPEESTYLESEHTGTDQHTAEFLADDIVRVFEQYPARWAGSVTDNTAANKKSWKILKEKYPNRFFYGCICHALHLFGKDLLGRQQVRREGDPGYCFNKYSVFVADCKDIVLYFKNHHLVKGQLEALQAEQHAIKLSLPGDTRWGCCSLS